MAKYLLKITADVKTAMKARDRDRLTVLRMLVAGIQEEQHRLEKPELSDAEEMQVLLRAVKTRKDSVEQATEYGRPEIADKESAEIVIVESYLPQQMTAEETASKVLELVKELGYEGPRDTGRFMKEWMSRYKGMADGREVQKVLKGLESTESTESTESG